MPTRTTLSAIPTAVVALLLLAQVALADTCCATAPIALDPPAAIPGQTVRLIGMRCLTSDGAQTNPLKLGRFLLTARSPDVPGAGPTAAGLTAVKSWLAFKQVPSPAQAIGVASIIVPNLPRGDYQLWWWCDDGSGPGGGIHYSTGPRLRIGIVAPDTATEPSVPTDIPQQRVPALLVLGVAVFLIVLRRGHPGR